MVSLRSTTNYPLYVWQDGARQTHDSNQGKAAHEVWDLNIIRQPANSPEVDELGWAEKGLPNKQVND